jgi:adenylate kinase family enzyme
VHPKNALTLASPRKVAVVGASGSGKSTLAATVAERLAVPYIELDALNHGPGWTEASADELRDRVRVALGDHGWVADGNYERKLGDLVVSQADLVVWLDVPLRVVLWRLTRRTAARLVRRTELWHGNRESLRNAFVGRGSLFAWAVASHRQMRRELPDRLAGLPGVRVVRLRSPAAVSAWLDTVGTVAAE